jgi:hypothetical protein
VRVCRSNHLSEVCGCARDDSGVEGDGRLPQLDERVLGMAHPVPMRTVNPHVRRQADQDQRERLREPPPVALAGTGGRRQLEAGIFRTACYRSIT